jgi:hypothetical protein
MLVQIRPLSFFLAPRSSWVEVPEERFAAGFPVPLLDAFQFWEEDPGQLGRPWTMDSRDPRAPGFREYTFLPQANDEDVKSMLKSQLPMLLIIPLTRRSGLRFEMVPADGEGKRWRFTELPGNEPIFRHHEQVWKHRPPRTSARSSTG